MEAELDAVRQLDELIRRAVQARASDIHIEPKPNRLRVRFRIDGVMVEQRPLPAALAAPIVSRAKVLGRMDISEKRVPQDGQFAVPLGGASVSIRASTFPSTNGEKVVLRLLFEKSLILLENLGLSADDLSKVCRVVTRSSGLVLVCGPTGAGKTTTLYSLLSAIDPVRLNVVTLEDPVEVELAEITQGQAHPRAGFTFASGLRAILRQDPDVILVGEMRDPETAQIAFQASLTGHMVLSTLHTASTVETIVRLLDLGIEPYVVAHAMSAVVAQRLARMLCPQCAEPVDLVEELYDEDEVVLLAGTRVRRPRGCSACFGSGYRGRIGLFEILEIDDRMREPIKRKASALNLKKIAAESGMRSLRRSGFELVYRGVTSVDEVLRVT